MTVYLCLAAAAFFSGIVIGMRIERFLTAIDASGGTEHG